MQFELQKSEFMKQRNIGMELGLNVDSEVNDNSISIILLTYIFVSNELRIIEY